MLNCLLPPVLRNGFDIIIMFILVLLLLIGVKSVPRFLPCFRLYGGDWATELDRPVNMLFPAVSKGLNLRLVSLLPKAFAAGDLGRLALKSIYFFVSLSVFSRLRNMERSISFFSRKLIWLSWSLAYGAVGVVNLLCTVENC